MDIVRQWFECLRVCEDSLSLPVGFELSRAFEEVLSLGLKSPTEQNKVFSGFGLATFLAIGVVYSLYLV